MNSRSINQGRDSFSNVFGTVPQYLIRGEYNTKDNKSIRPAQRSCFQDSTYEASEVARENEIREIEEQYRQHVSRKKESLSKLRDEVKKLHNDEVQSGAGKQLVLKRSNTELKQKHKVWHHEDRFIRPLVREKLEKKRRGHAELCSAIVKDSLLEVSKDLSQKIQNEDRQFSNIMNEKRFEETKSKWKKLKIFTSFFIFLIAFIIIYVIWSW